MTDPLVAPDVLADLLVAASEKGPEKLVEVDRLLRSLAPDPVVDAAHRRWTERLRSSVDEPWKERQRIAAGWLEVPRMAERQRRGRAGRPPLEVVEGGADDA